MFKTFADKDNQKKIDKGKKKKNDDKNKNADIGT